MLIHEEVLHYHLTVNSLITLALQTEVRALKNTICNMNMETIKMLALWIKIIWIEMVDSTYPEIKKLKIQIYNCLLFTDSYSSSNLSTKINLIRKKCTLPGTRETYYPILTRNVQRKFICCDTCSMPALHWMSWKHHSPFKKLLL